MVSGEMSVDLVVTPSIRVSVVGCPIWLVLVLLNVL